jgi:DNA-binding LacI/PurR family transcriptional regulator
MSTRSPTSFEVARKARVSRTTVSLVLNRVPGASISERTRARVLKAAHDMGYVPHAMGKALASRKTRNIGVAYSTEQASHSFLQLVIEGLSQATRKRDQRLLVESFDEHDRAQKVLELTRARHIDGLVMWGPRHDDPVIAALARDGFPLVMIGSLKAEGLCTIDIDNREAAKGIVAHLLDLGHRRIACITNAPTTYTASADRLVGYREALCGRGMKPDVNLIRQGNFTAESGYEAMQSILDGNRKPPSAVFAASDLVAFGVMKAIHEQRLRIPTDVSVVGFDDIPLAAYATPPLTTVSFSGIREGIRAGEILMDLLDGKIRSGYHETIETRLVVRQSTAKPGRRAAAHG